MADAVRFTAPGPGAWELETTHYNQPVTRFFQQAMLDGFAKGFAASTARYGVMLSHLEPGFANGFTYMRAVGFGAPANAMGPPPKPIVQVLTRLLPSMRKRIQAGHDAFMDKRWRQDMARWDGEVKPAAITRHLHLQSVDLSLLDDAALAQHVRDAYRHLAAMIEQHHDFTLTVAVPIGDFLAHVQQWTNLPAGQILQALRGSTRISLGVAQDELAAVAAVVRSNPELRALLGGPGPANMIVEALLAHGASAFAMKAYLDLMRWRCLGYDLGSKSVGEMPELVVRSIQAALDGAGGQRDDANAARARIQALRQSVPAEHQVAFDVLVDEVRFVNRLRDERGHFSDGWAVGLARRALGEAGRRLVQRGVFTGADAAYDATRDEIVDLLEGRPGPSEAELQARAAWRASKTTADPDIPPWLGAPPTPPPPADWLPPNGRRTARAVEAFLTTMFIEPAARSTDTSVRGLPVSPGVYEGTARVVNDEAEFGRIERGDVLVARSTSPYFNVVLPLLGAIVTDRGGQLCHAAIVAREYGVPGVVGTRDACKVIPDGARVRVDGGTGEVTVLAWHPRDRPKALL